MDDSERDPLVADLAALIDALREHPDLLRELLEGWPQPLTPAQRAALGDIVTVH